MKKEPYLIICGVLLSFSLVLLSTFLFADDLDNDGRDDEVLECPCYIDSILKNPSFECYDEDFEGNNFHSYGGSDKVQFIGNLGGFNTYLFDHNFQHTNQDGSVTKLYESGELGDTNSIFYCAGWYTVGDDWTENANYFRYFADRVNTTDYYYIPDNTLNACTNGRTRYPMGTYIDINDNYIVDTTQLAYIGINTTDTGNGNRGKSFEFIQQRLKKKMEVGDLYTVSFYVSKNMESNISQRIAAVLSNEAIGFDTIWDGKKFVDERKKSQYIHENCKVTLDSITGEYFGDNISVVQSGDVIPNNGGPIGIDDWVKVSGTFKVLDPNGYKYITIGCFTPTEQNNTPMDIAYYIDNIEITHHVDCPDCELLSGSDFEGLVYIGALIKRQNDCAYEYMFKYSFISHVAQLNICDLNRIGIKCESSSTHYTYKYYESNDSSGVFSSNLKYYIEDLIVFENDPNDNIVIEIELIRGGGLDTCFLTRMFDIDCDNIPDCDCDSNSFEILSPAIANEDFKTETINYEYDILLNISYCDYDSLHIYINDIYHYRNTPYRHYFDQDSGITLKKALIIPDSSLITPNNSKVIRIDLFNADSTICSLEDTIDFDTICVKSCENYNMYAVKQDSSCCHDIYVSNSSDCAIELDEIDLEISNIDLRDWIVSSVFNDPQNNKEDNLYVSDTQNTKLEMRCDTTFTILPINADDYITIPANTDSFQVATLCLITTNSGTELFSSTSIEKLICDNTINMICGPCKCNNEIENMLNIYQAKLIHTQEDLCYDLWFKREEQEECSTLYKIAVLDVDSYQNKDTLYVTTYSTILNSYEYLVEDAFCFENAANGVEKDLEIVFYYSDGFECIIDKTEIIKAACLCDDGNLAFEAIPHATGSCCYDLILVNQPNCHQMLSRIDLSQVDGMEYIDINDFARGANPDLVKWKDFDSDTISLYPDDDSLFMRILPYDTLFIGQYCNSGNDIIAFNVGIYKLDSLICYEEEIQLESCYNCDTNNIQITVTSSSSSLDFCCYDIDIDITDLNDFDRVKIENHPDYNAASDNNIRFSHCLMNGASENLRIVFLDDDGNVLCERWVNLDCGRYYKRIEKADKIIEQF